MRRPDFRLTCCLCRRPIPRGADAYALDAEWRRRFRNMKGTLACGLCATERHQWECGRHGHWRGLHSFLDGISHIEDEGTQRAMVLLFPASAIRQGAAAYLAWWVARFGGTAASWPSTCALLSWKPVAVSPGPVPGRRAIARSKASFDLL